MKVQTHVEENREVMDCLEALAVCVCVCVVGGGYCLVVSGWVSVCIYWCTHVCSYEGRQVHN